MVTGYGVKVTGYGLKVTGYGLKSCGFNGYGLGVEELRVTG